jgi:hypothetical protein
MKNHWLWMVLGCAIPLLLIFLAPSLGITGYNGLFAFILLMFAIHLLMPMHHSRHGHGKHSEDNKGASSDTEKGHQHH